MREYLIVALIAAGTTYLSSGLWRQIALRHGAVAKVRDRDVHVVPIPYFGGVAMLCGVAAAVLVASRLPFLGSRPEVSHDVLAVLLAAAVICIIGVLDALFEHSTRPEFIYRHQWKAGDMVFWDNRSLMHLAAGCPPDQRRKLYRTTIAGDVPF